MKTSEQCMCLLQTIDSTAVLNMQQYSRRGCLRVASDVGRNLEAGSWISTEGV